MSLALFRYRLACSGAADTDIITDVATATAISSTAAEEIIVNLISVLFRRLFGVKSITCLHTTQLDKFLSLILCKIGETYPTFFSLFCLASSALDGISHGNDQRH